MPYDEQSFLNGLAAGLTATGGTMLGRYYGNGYYVLPYLPGDCTAEKIHSAGVEVSCRWRSYPGEIVNFTLRAVRKFPAVVKCATYPSSYTPPDAPYLSYPITWCVFACLKQTNEDMAEAARYNSVTNSGGTDVFEKIGISADSVYSGTSQIYYKRIMSSIWGYTNESHTAIRHQSLAEALNAMDDGKWLF